MALFIKNFLAHIIFRIQNGNKKLDPHKQKAGVLQGSILFVTLFILKISSIVKTINSSIRKFLYVDDLSVTYSSWNMSSIERHISPNKIEKWTNKYGFQKLAYYLDPQLKINEFIISIIQQTEYIGVILENKLKFKVHINHLSQKCQYKNWIGVKGIDFISDWN